MKSLCLGLLLVLAATLAAANPPEIVILDPATLTDDGFSIDARYTEGGILEADIGYPLAIDGHEAVGTVLYVILGTSRNIVSENDFAAGVDAPVQMRLSAQLSGRQDDAFVDVIYACRSSDCSADRNRHYRFDFIRRTFTSRR